jgi:transposase
MTKASEWAARVEAWRASGQSASDYCASRDYTAKSLQWWASRLRRNEEAGRSQPSAEPVRFARVVSVKASPEQRTAPTGVVVMQLGALRVEVPPGTDRATLTTVIEALGLGSAGSAR